MTSLISYPQLDFQPLFGPSPTKLRLEPPAFAAARRFVNTLHGNHIIHEVFRSDGCAAILVDGVVQFDSVVYADFIPELNPFSDAW